jgi:protein YibB
MVLKDDPVIVTAFIDIGRARWSRNRVGLKKVPRFLDRSVDTYIESFRRLTRLKNEILVFGESGLRAKLGNLPSNVKFLDLGEDYLSQHQELLEEISQVQRNPIFKKFINDPRMPEYWSPEYVLVNFLKATFVNRAISDYSSSEKTFAWIDFGYAKDFTTIPTSEPWVVPTTGRLEIFAFEDPMLARPVFKYTRENKVVIQGCHLIGPATSWVEFQQLMEFAIKAFLSVGMIDDDQGLMLLAVQKHPEIFGVNRAIPGWFNVFDHFNA